MPTSFSCLDGFFYAHSSSFRYACIIPRAVRGDFRPCVHKHSLTDGAPRQPKAMYSENGGLHSLFTKPSVFTFISFVTLLGLSALVCLGFKTEWSSLLLAVILFLSNIYM